MRRGVVLTAAVLGIVAILAPPASANPVLEGLITVGDQEFEIPGEEEQNCPGEQNLPITFTPASPPTTPASGTWDASNGFFKSPFQLDGNPQKYQAELDFLASSVGTYTQTAAGPPATYALAGRFDVEAKLQTLTKVYEPAEDPEDPPVLVGCTKTDVCRVRARLILSPTSEHSGSIPPATGDVTTIDSSTANTGGVNTVAVGGSCPVTLQSALVNKVATTAVTLTWP